MISCCCCLVYLFEYAWKACTLASIKHLSIKCKITLIKNQYMTIFKMDVLTKELMSCFVYLSEYTYKVCSWPSMRPVSIKCNIVLIMNQCMTIIYEMGALPEELMFFLFSILGRIYIRGFCLAKYKSCVYWMQDSTNNESMHDYYL